MPKKLKGLEVREVSGVDAAANRRKFLLTKAATQKPTGNPKGATNMAKKNALANLAKALNPFKTRKADLPEGAQALLDQLLEATGGEGETPSLVDYVEDQQEDRTLEDICAGLEEALDDLQDDENNPDKQSAVAALLEDLKSMLGSLPFLKAAGVLKAGRKISSSNLAILQQIDTLLDQLITAAGGNPAQADQDDEQQASDGDNGSDDGQDDEEDQDPSQMQAMQMARKARKEEREKKRAARKEESMKKSAEVVSLEKKVQKMEADLAKAAEKTERSELLAKSEKIGPVLGLTVQKMADHLFDLKKANPALAEETERQWKAAAEMARKSMLFGEIGKSSQGGAPDAATQMVAKAQEIAKRDGIKFADAMTKASNEDPALYAEYVKNQRKGA